MPTLTDGPAAHRTITYKEPLPHTLVIATRNPTRYHDYHRIPDTNQYRHSPHCPTCTPTPQ